MREFGFLDDKTFRFLLGLVFLAFFMFACSGGDNTPATSDVDTTPPVITLNGENPLTLVQGDLYVEPGATAIDDSDGSVSVTITGTVDSNTPGSYTITYSASDSSGNLTTTVRTVIVNNAVQRPFITTWKTDNPGVTANNQIMINTEGSGYNYSVDWGDGQTDSNVSGDVTHTYATIGTYTVSISGDFPRIYSTPTATDADKLLSIEQWGDIQWTSMSHAFAYCSNVVSNALDSPNLSQVTDMSGMFVLAKAFNQDISGWDVSSVTNMGQMFLGADAFNQDIGGWNVSSVTNMSGMLGAKSFDQDISSWDVSAVTDMSKMFNGAEMFNQAIGSWNVSSVTDMHYMFFDARSFNQPLNSWNVSLVTDMRYMFYNATNFNQNLSGWDVSSVTNMANMFAGGLDDNTFNQDISTWNVSSVTNMNSMFRNAVAFNQDISLWNVSAVTDMSYMFYNAISFNQNIGAWNVIAVSDMSYMFSRLFSRSASAFDQDIGNWNVSSVTNMSHMFSYADAFNQDIGSWNVSAVTDMNSMFYYATNFDQNLGAWVVSLVTNMSYMFAGDTLSIANYDALLSGWSLLNLQTGVNFHAGNSKYSSSSQAARDVLTGTFNWIVSDGGVAP